MILKSSLLLLVVMFLSCSSPAPTEPEWKREPGKIMMYVDGTPVPYTELAMPDTVDAGAFFKVRFATFAGTLCEREDNIVVMQSGLFVTITPYDIVPPPYQNCQFLMQHFERSLELKFDRRGKATVQLHGNLPVNGNLAVIERTIIVR